jgi:predicted RNA-binding Zn ribbon-like protein
MPEHRFQMVGGDPVLNFVNTIHDWTVPQPRDYLPTFPEAVRFAEAAGLLTRSEARRLAASSPRAELRRLRELRALLERIFRAVVSERSPTPGDLTILAEESAAAAGAVRLRSERGHVVRAIDPETAGAATLRARLAEGAVALLTSERLQRLGTCPACGWFFLDTTKNRSRRWCSMAMCGNAAKSRSYYWRTKRRSGGRSSR